MKQHITTKQLKELSEKGKDELMKWFVGKLESNPDWDDILVNPDGMLLSIGQMIEFLGNETESISCWEDGWMVIERRGTKDKSYTKSELCDALWDAVKEVLNEKI